MYEVKLYICSIILFTIIAIGIYFLLYMKPNIISVIRGRSDECLQQYALVVQEESSIVSEEDHIGTPQCHWKIKVPQGVHV